MAEESLADWRRTEYVESGDVPFLYYRVYGRIDLSRPMSRRVYQCGGLPAGIELVQACRADHPAVFNDPVDGVLGDVRRAAFPALDRMLSEAANAVTFWGTPDDATKLNYFRDTLGLITWLLDAGGTFVYDPMQLKCWSAEEWRESVAGKGFDVRRHGVILWSPEDGRPDRRWYHTRGLRKFGRPDVSVRMVPESHCHAVEDLVNRLIVHQANGGVLDREIRMRSLPAVAAVMRGGSVDDPDFNNVHLEIRFEGW